MPGIEPCNFVLYRGRLYQQDVRSTPTKAEVGRALGRLAGRDCGAYRFRGVKAFAARGRSASDVVIVVDNYAPLRYVVQPAHSCSRAALRIGLSRRGVYHGRGTRIVLIRNASALACTLPADVTLTVVRAGTRISFGSPHPRTFRLLPQQALNLLIGSGSGDCPDRPQYTQLLEVKVGLVTGAYLRHSGVQTNCGTPEVFDAFTDSS